MEIMKAFNIAFIGVAVIWIGGIFLSYTTFDDWATRGQFGDSFGFVNALFSGLAFVGLTYTIWMQRSELELQREELKLQREEMSASRGELANQAAAQRALFQATVAQIAVAAAQAEIEALKMEGNPQYAFIQQDAVSKVRAVAASLSALSARIEGTGGDS